MFSRLALNSWTEAALLTHPPELQHYSTLHCEWPAFWIFFLLFKCCSQCPKHRYATCYCLNSWRRLLFQRVHNLKFPGALSKTTLLGVRASTTEFVQRDALIHGCEFAVSRFSQLRLFGKMASVQHRVRLVTCLYSPADTA